MTMALLLGGISALAQTTVKGTVKDEKKLGYAVSTVNSESLMATASPTLGTALYGKAAGVRVTTTPLTTLSSGPRRFSKTGYIQFKKRVTRFRRHSFFYIFVNKKNPTHK